MPQILEFFFDCLISARIHAFVQVVLYLELVVLNHLLRHSVFVGIGKPLIGVSPEHKHVQEKLDLKDNFAITSEHLSTLCHFVIGSNEEHSLRVTAWYMDRYKAFFQLTTRPSVSCVQLVYSCSSCTCTIPNQPNSDIHMVILQTKAIYLASI